MSTLLKKTIVVQPKFKEQNDNILSYTESSKHFLKFSNILNYYERPENFECVATLI